MFILDKLQHYVVLFFTRWIATLSIGTSHKNGKEHVSQGDSKSANAHQPFRRNTGQRIFFSVIFSLYIYFLANKLHTSSYLSYIMFLRFNTTFRACCKYDIHPQLFYATICSTVRERASSLHILTHSRSLWPYSSFASIRQTLRFVSGTDTWLWIQLRIPVRVNRVVLPPTSFALNIKWIICRRSGVPVLGELYKDKIRSKTCARR